MAFSFCSPTRPGVLPLLAVGAGLLVVAVFATTVASADPADPTAGPISPDEFRALHALARPTASEQAWRRIPWRTNLTAARTEAAAAGKPILLWEMDGHPLGCV